MKIPYNSPRTYTHNYLITFVNCLVPRQVFAKAYLLFIPLCCYCAAFMTGMACVAFCRACRVNDAYCRQCILKMSSNIQTWNYVTWFRCRLHRHQQYGLLLTRLNNNFQRYLCTNCVLIYVLFGLQFSICLSYPTIGEWWSRKSKRNYTLSYLIIEPLVEITFPRVSAIYWDFNISW